MSLYNRLKHLYDRRWTQYTRTGNVALCCIAKMENDYLRFFVEYYQHLHVDKIFLYDNNDPDGERFDAVIGDYIQSGFVEVTDFRGKKVAQLEAYHDCYVKHQAQYSWMAFFDCDEFLTFADGSSDIHAFLMKIKFWNYQVMHVNWKIYGDNDLLDNDGRSVVERFKNPVLPYDFIPKGSEIPENNHVKSIIRGGLSAVNWSAAPNPHTISSDFYHCCNPKGERVDLNSPFMDFDDSILFLRHYNTKTVGEWVRNKMRRGVPDRSADQWQQVLNLDFFFRFNERTKEKVQYAEKLLKEIRHE